jgi:hypothetical protein
MMGDPRSMLRSLKRGMPRDVSGNSAHFAGFGMHSLSLASGDVMAFTQVAASSLGPPFTAVWHRDSDGDWRVRVNIAPSRSCLRFLLTAASDVRVDDITVVWKSRLELSLYMRDARVHLGLRLGTSAATNAMAVAAALVPGPFWQADAALRVMGRGAGAALGTGRLRLAGRTPSGHRFRLRPTGVWGVAAAAAVFDGRDPGPMLGATARTTPGGSVVVARPLFAVGTAAFLAGPATEPGGEADAA